MAKSSATSPHVSNFADRCRHRIRWHGDVRLGSTQYRKGKENEKPKSVFEKDDGAGDGAHVLGRFERHAR